MKSAFRAYYQPSDNELTKIWQDGLIVLDTNALLNILRYSATTRDELLDLLENKKEQIWIPYQVGFEFHRNRRKMPSELRSAFGNVESALDDALKKVGAELTNLERHAQPEAEELREALDDLGQDFKEKLKQLRGAHDVAVTSEEAQKKTFNRISALYDGRVGQPFSDEDLQKLYKEGAERYAKEVPPGYKDQSEKKDERRFGDLVLWRQILLYAAEKKKPLLFVTDDNKEDWWEIVSGKTIGPRPELIEEYYEASGARAHFYNLRRYLSYAKEHGANISDTSMDEVKKTSIHVTLPDTTLQSFKKAFARQNDPVWDRLADSLPKFSDDAAYQNLMNSVISAQNSKLGEGFVKSLLDRQGEQTMRSVQHYLAALNSAAFKPTSEQNAAMHQALLRALNQQLTESEQAQHESGGDGESSIDDSEPQTED